MMKMFITAIVTLALALASPAAAQSASDLLQKGIYTQESLGNLDAAITIYKQILGDAAASRVYAAQAQFRLGLCYVQKGQQADAAETFQKLIKDYPEQTELVAKAKEYVPGGLKLLPVPWEDGEALATRAEDRRRRRNGSVHLDGGSRSGRSTANVVAGHVQVCADYAGTLQSHSRPGDLPADQERRARPLD